MPISIYPPTLQSSQPAFLYSETSYPIYFTLQKITQFNEIGHIQIRVVRQSNNRTIVNTSKYPDGTIYKSSSQIFVENNSQYSISILSTDLAESWQPGTLYKVQMRFGINAMFTNVSNFADWKQTQIDQGAFSEWSTVMIIKAINRPQTYIENAEAIIAGDLVSSERTEPTLTPIFYGICATVASDKEIVNKYKFDLYLGEKDIKDFEAFPEENLIESSGWLQHNAVVNMVDQHRFSNVLTNDTIYTVFYSIETVNGYKDMAQPYIFLATRTYLDELEGVKLFVDSTSAYCKENGCINLSLTTTTPLSGTFLITRSSEKSNYEVWEDLHYLLYSAKPFNNTLIFQDFTIESGVKYKYAFQQENSAGLRTSPIYDEHNSPHYVDFEYSYLYHNDVQLRLMFNQKISSFKYTTLTSKQDTLGGKYPHLVRNGYAYYAEFPISGLISFQMDRDKTFLKLNTDGFHQNNEVYIPRDKLVENSIQRLPCTENQNTVGSPGAVTDYNDLGINHDLTSNNIFVERKFRERVEAFLNNFDYKLYKSPTEGNIVVVLQNVSLQPNDTVGRMLYSFSATAYEVMENTLENLNKVGITNIGQFQTLTSNEVILSFGQIDGLYNDTNTDIYSQVKQQEEVSIGGGYKLQLKRIRSFWVERYPNQESILNRDYEGQVMTGEQVRNRPVGSAELTQLRAQLAKALNEEESADVISALKTEIEKYEDLQTVVETAWEESEIIIGINGKSIRVSPGRLYSLTYSVSSLEVIYSEYPIIVNYVCELNQVEDLSVGIVTAIDASRIWGQVSGVFTSTEAIIRDGYNYSYDKYSGTYRVYDKNGIATTYDKYGNVILDDTKYNLYKTLDLYEVIKEDTRKQVEVLYGVEGGFQLNQNGEWANGPIRYNFSGITSFDIEASPNTTLRIGKEVDGSDAITIKIGASGRYILTPMENLVRYIKLEDAAFAIINYKCLTTQMRVKTEGG